MYSLHRNTLSPGPWTYTWSLGVVKLAATQLLITVLRAHKTVAMQHQIAEVRESQQHIWKLLLQIHSNINTVNYHGQSPIAGY
jgi:hypothetical protein